MKNLNSDKAALEKLSTRGQAELSAKKPMIENCMLRDSLIEDVVNEIDWEPDIEICAEETRSNSICPLFFCAGVDSRRQKRYLLGKRIWCNPSYKFPRKFIRLLEECYRENS